MSKKHEIAPFLFEGHNVRIVLDEQGEPLFVGKDICKVLGYANHNDAISTHCKGAAIYRPISEQVAIAQAVAEKLGQRQGKRTDLATCGNISTSDEEGKTRDIAAAKAGLGSGKTYEAAPMLVLQRDCPEKPCLRHSSRGVA